MDVLQGNKQILKEQVNRRGLISLSVAVCSICSTFLLECRSGSPIHSLRKGVHGYCLIVPVCVCSYTIPDIYVSHEVCDWSEGPVTDLMCDTMSCNKPSIMRQMCYLVQCVHISP